MTDAFEGLFKLEAEQRGAPELPYIVIPHPLGGIQPDAVEEKAREATSALRAALLGNGA
ncbi:MAG: hypothetical protein OXG61_13115 [Chloroflexi bacterium]|nr:hypothetical protein [Chloroflexota bacterium]